MCQVRFIDCHCHLFNIADIPLYATVEAAELGINSLNALAVALASRKAGSELYQRKEIILFFERSIEENIEFLVQQVEEALAEDANIDVGLTVLTPLVMDFDLIRPTFLDQLHAGDGLVERDHAAGWSGLDAQLKDRKGQPFRLMMPERAVLKQITRLRDAVTNKDQWLLDRQFKILPFLGYDPRKLLDTGLDGFKTLWNTVGGVTDKVKRSDPGNLRNGDVIGVKLYPPMGFNPCGSSPAEQKLFLEFYAWLSENEIPITVHCQKGSYSTQTNKIAERTNPSNWANILGTEYKWKHGPLEGQTTELGRLMRINFAHFAGEEDMDDMVDWTQKGGIDQNTWAWTIVKMLKQYPNTYSDLAAFDFSPHQVGGIDIYNGAVNALFGLLDKDAGGVLPDVGTHMVCDKMLWGSDVPMIISGNWLRKECCDNNESHYKYLHGLFCETVQRCKNYNDDGKRGLIRKITVNNAMKFLFQ